MKSIKPFIFILVFASAPAVAANLLEVSDEERALLGIVAEAPQHSDAIGTAEVTLRADFTADGKWAVKTPFSGILHRAWVQVGDRVRAGDPLVAVRSSEVVELQWNFLKAKAELDLQEVAINRDRKLKEAGSVSARRWQETEYSFRNARAEYAGLRAQLQLAGYDESDLDRLVTDMEISPDITLRAPVDALVLQRPAVLGEHLDGSELLALLGEPDKLVLAGTLSLAAASTLTPGARLVGNDGAEAVLSFISTVIDPESQTVEVRAEPLNPEALRAGQIGNWNVMAGGSAWLLPPNAVVKLDGADTVFVSVAGGFEPREVQVRSAGSSGWLVLDGLSDGERVAVSGTVVLKGMSVGMGGGED